MLRLLRSLRSLIIQYIRITLATAFLVGLSFSQIFCQNPGSWTRTLEASIWADSLMERMSLREKIGQAIMIAAYSNRDSTHVQQIDSLIKDYFVGGLIFFQGDPKTQAELTNHYQSISKLPLWLAMDAEWGLGMRLDSAISYPYQLTLGTIQNNNLIYEMGSQIARQMRMLGVHINFAPVMDVNNNPDNPVINFRSFGDNTQNVSAKSEAYFKGLQDFQILPTGKHFPGHGDTNVDSHLDLPVINHDWGRLEEVELAPFRNAIQNGMGGVMVAHLSIPALDSTKNLPTTLSKPVISGLLRDSLGFKGLVFTDALQMEGITKHFEPGEIEIRALEAGNDLLLFPQDVRKASDAIVDAVNSGRISQNLIDEICRKVLITKYGLQVESYTPIDESTIVEKLNDLEFQLLRRRLYRESMTVIKNDAEILPLERIDSLKIASVSIGHGENSIFEERLSQYTNVDHFYIDRDNIDQIKDNLPKQLELYNLIVVLVDDLSKWPGRNYGVDESLDELISSLAESNNTILAWLNSQYGLSRLSSLQNHKAIIVGHEENDLTRDYTAQLIFGGIGTNSRLSVAISSEYPSGHGFDIEGGLRLSYLLPEEAGLDGDYLESNLDSIANYAIAEGVAPGIQLLVAKDSKVVFHKTYGHHTYDEKDVVKKGDLYDLASITKISGALPAMMRLHDEEQFDLDAALGDYIPEFKKGNKKDIQLRPILSHNAQLRAWIPYWRTTIKKNGKFRPKTFEQDSSENYSVKVTDELFLHKDYKKKIYKQIRKSDLLEEPGYVYSGLSFYLFPEIVENLTGNDFESHLKETFYRPLGANTITYNPYKHFSLDDIIPTELDTFFRHELIHGKVHDEGAAMMDGVSSNAGLFASTNDLAKLMQMYLNMGSYGGETYISKWTMQKFTTTHYAEEGNRRGLAFDKPLLTNREEGSTAVDVGDSSFGHSGFTGTFAWMDPETGIMFLFMSNRVYPTRENRKLYQLSIRPSMHQVIYDSRL